MLSLLCLAALLLSAEELPAQLGSAAVRTQPSQPKALYIDVLEGEGELNDIHARTAREPIVEVRDENHKPVAGALVLFSIHSGGAAPASFSGLPTLSVRTGSDGRAVARGFQLNKHAGSYTIAVAATVGAVAAAAEIHEINYAPGVHGVHSLVANKPLLFESLFVAGYVAAAATVVVTAQPPSATAITVGTGTVSAPALHLGGAKR